ncbi:glucose transporter [Aspergillus sp. HF37]|nr:glucose transporter [Aspergillus sp. HF37]
MVMFLHAYFMFPETAGKTLEETEAMFGDPNGIPYIGTPAWKTGKNTIAILRMERGNLDFKPGTQEMPTGEERVVSEEV